MRNDMEVFAVICRRNGADDGTQVAVLARDSVHARKLAIDAYRRRNDLPTSANVFAALDLRGSK